MIGEICAEIKNFFAYETDRHIGDWVISSSSISPFLDIPTDYIRIIGSRLNDGVHVRDKNGAFGLVDEEFHGAIWIMSPPKDFLDLASEIENWNKKYCNADSISMSPYTSESFNGYAYSKGAGTGGGLAASWQSAYADKLVRYRRLREL